MAGATPQRGLVLLDEEVGEPVPARWAWHLLGLGSRVARRRQREGWQLVVAVSLPTRDFAAGLIAAGWILAQPSFCREDVLAKAQAIESGCPVRMAADLRLVAGRFYGVDCTRGRVARVHIGGTFWKIDAVDRIAADPMLPEERFGRVEIARPGSLLGRTGHGATWAAEQCAPGPTVALVGIRSRLEPELAMQAGWASWSDGDYDRLLDIVRPDDGKSAFYSSVILPGGRDFLPDIPSQARLGVLDGATATRWLPELRTPIVVALIDRSAADESAGIAVLQRRSIGEPVQLDALGWSPLPGMEALAFEVRI